MHLIKIFVYSYMLLLKQQTCKVERKCILFQFWNRIAEYFGDIESKVGSFVTYILWHQNYLGMDYLPIGGFKLCIFMTPFMSSFANSTPLKDLMSFRILWVNQDFRFMNELHIKMESMIHCMRFNVDK